MYLNCFSLARFSKNFNVPFDQKYRSSICFKNSFQKLGRPFEVLRENKKLARLFPLPSSFPVKENLDRMKNYKIT